MREELERVREREAFFKVACQQKDEEYRAILDEQGKALDEIARLRAEIEEKQQAIAILQAQSQQQLQLTLPLVTDSLDPAVTSEESLVISQQSTITNEESAVSSQEPEWNTRKTLKTSELADYINQKFNPQKPISKQNLTDAARGASKRMPEYESNYGFKFLGKIRGEYRFKILS